MKTNYSVDNADSIGKYFKEIRKVDLLTIEEEVELAYRIQGGDTEAINKLVEANLKFVVKVAKEFQNQGMLLSDLINEGNYGLIKAAKKFDPTRGFRFISYAVYWIRQAIMQSLNENGRTIRLPVNVIQKMAALKKQIEQFEFEHERQPIDFDIMDDDSSFEELITPTCNSLNDYIGDEGDEISDLVSDTTNIEELIIKETDGLKLKTILNRTLSVLSERERCIVECYFGLNSDYEKMTLEDIGEKYDLTKERIRQIKEKAIRKLRKQSSSLHTLLHGNAVKANV